MKLSKVSAQIVLVYCALVSAAPLKVGEAGVVPQPTVSDFSPILASLFGTTQASILPTPPKAPSPEVISPETSKPINISSLKTDLMSSLFKILSIDLSNIKVPAFFNQLLISLANSGAFNFGLDFVLTNPRLLQLSIDATIKVLESGLVNLTDLLIALNKSGMVPQILELALDDPEIFPGVLQIGKELLKVNGINIFSKRDMELLEASIDNEAQEDLDIHKRENQYLNLVFSLIADSGLGTLVIQHLLTSPDLANPSAQFLNAVVRSGAITPGEILSAVKESNMLPELFKQILSDKALLVHFAKLVKEKIKKGIFSKNLFEGA